MNSLIPSPFTGLDSIPTRQTRVGSVATPTYNPSAAGYYTYTTSTPPSSRGRKTSYAPGDNGSATMHLPVSTLLTQLEHVHNTYVYTCQLYSLLEHHSNLDHHGNESSLRQ